MASEREVEGIVTGVGDFVALGQSESVQFTHDIDLKIKRIIFAGRWGRFHRLHDAVAG